MPGNGAVPKGECKTSFCLDRLVPIMASNAGLFSVCFLSWLRKHVQHEAVSCTRDSATQKVAASHMRRCEVRCSCTGPVRATLARHGHVIEGTTNKRRHRPSSHGLHTRYNNRLIRSKGSYLSCPVSQKHFLFAFIFQALLHTVPELNIGPDSDRKEKVRQIGRNMFQILDLVYCPIGALGQVRAGEP